MRKPAVFIGSSVERLDVAYAMQEHLEYAMEPTVWTQDIFKPSSYVLVDLERAARTFQFAIFVFAPDDIVTIRGVQSGTTRDNIIFEFGLFVGALGLARCFFLVPRGTQSLHLPTDILGLTPLTYAPDRSDKNLIAAVAPAANRVRRAIREQVNSDEEYSGGTAEKTSDRRDKAGSFLSAHDYVDLWNSARFNDTRKAAGMLPWNPNGYDDEEKDFYDAIRRLFAFLENMADAVLSGDIDEATARLTFEEPIRTLWPHMYTSMAPPNHADDWWKPLPRIADLYVRWTHHEGG